MIRKNIINCKLIQVKKSTAHLFESYMNSCRPELESCPVCGLRGSLKVHGYYDRFIIDFIDGKPVCEKLHVMRLGCSCGHTHALIPDPIIPFKCYSLFFILRVVWEYSCRVMTVDALCKRFCITQSILYRWIKLYLDHRLVWEKLIDTIDQSMLSSLKKLFAKDPYSAFSAFFIDTSGRSFLQSHKNPSLLKRKAHLNKCVCYPTT